MILKETKAIRSHVTASERSTLIVGYLHVKISVEAFNYKRTLVAAMASANHMLRATGTGIAGCHDNVRLSGENDLQAASSKRSIYSILR